MTRIGIKDNTWIYMKWRQTLFDTGFESWKFFIQKNELRTAVDQQWLSDYDQRHHSNLKHHPHDEASWKEGSSQMRKETGGLPRPGGEIQPARKH